MIAVSARSNGLMTAKLVDDELLLSERPQIGDPCASSPILVFGFWLFFFPCCQSASRNKSSIAKNSYERKLSLGRHSMTSTSKSSLSPCLTFHIRPHQPLCIQQLNGSL